MTTITNTFYRESVDAGICANSNGFGSCALSADACVDESTTFLSSRETAMDSHAAGCITSRKTQQARIGSCNGEDGPCASSKELCSVPALFTVSSPDCQVMTNKLLEGDDDTKTKYGSCVSNEFPGGPICFWSNDFCNDKATFEFDENCTCDKVLVGGCRKKTNDDMIHCAVNAQSCDENQEFLSVVDMKSIMDCYLCREPPAAPTAATAPPSPFPTLSPVIFDNVPPLPKTPDKTLAGGQQLLSNNNNDNGGADVRLIASCVIGGLVAFGIVIIAAIKLKRSPPKPAVAPDGEYI